MKRAMRTRPFSPGRPRVRAWRSALLRRVRERRPVAAAPGERVVERGGGRAQRLDFDLAALPVVAGNDAGHGLLVDDRVGDTNVDVAPGAEPSPPRRVLELDARRPDLEQAAGLERPGELPQRRAAGVTGEDRLERVALRVVRPVVEVQEPVPG